MTWTRFWKSRDRETTVEITLDGDCGVEYIYDNTSVFPKWKEIYYDSALEVFMAMEGYHEDPDYEEA